MPWHRHIYFIEEFVDGAWVLVEERACECYIREDHWTERSINKEVA